MNLSINIMVAWLVNKGGTGAPIIRPFVLPGGNQIKPSPAQD